MEKGPLIGAGRTADVFAWGDDCILKLYQAWMPANAVEREFAITRLVCDTGLPVPAALETFLHVPPAGRIACQDACLCFAA